MTMLPLVIAGLTACSSLTEPTQASASSWIPYSNPAWPAGVQTLDKKQLRQTYEHYLIAWSAIPQAERRRILEDTLAHNIRYLDAMTSGTGIDRLANHLAAFQARRPGYSFTLGSLLTFGDEALANWEMRDPAGAVVVRGYDVMHIDPDGRISAITGFSDVDQMRA